MKKVFEKKISQFVITFVLTLAVLTLSFALPVRNLPTVSASVAQELVADNENETLIAPAPEEEKLSFTEKIASKFATSLGKYIPAELVVVFVSMLPILELRAGLFVAKFLDLPLIKAIPLCIVGNIIPIPLILLFIKKRFKWLGKTKLFHKLIEKLESRAMKKSKALANGEFVGLMLFVGIPIPGTGAWMGSLIAALLEVDFKKAIIAELVGIAIATVIVSILSYGLLGLFI